MRLLLKNVINYLVFLQLLNSFLNFDAVTVVVAVVDIVE